MSGNKCILFPGLNFHLRLVRQHLQLSLNPNQVGAISDGNNPLRPRLAASLASYWQFKQHILQLSSAIICD